MTEFLDHDSREIYGAHKEGAEDLKSSEAEIIAAGLALAEARVAGRRSSFTAESGIETVQASERFKRASEAHSYAHEEYPNSIAEGREYYEDNEASYQEMAVKDAAKDGFNTNFGQTRPSTEHPAGHKYSDAELGEDKTHQKSE